MNITLRKLELKDAERMYEWMQNPDICRYMQYDFSGQTLEDCSNFIKKSWEDPENRHFAVADEKDVYMGTVSLKNIDCVNKNAEFAIVMHMDAMGTGAAGRALHRIAEKAFFEIQLNKIYLYVRTDNIRAVKFYEKQHLDLEGCFKQHLYCGEKFRDIRYYALLRSEYKTWCEEG